MKKIIISLAIALLPLVAFGKTILFSQDNPTGMVPFNCKGAYEGTTLNIYYHIPEGDIRTMKVQIVMHGMNRNADGYRDSWIKSSDKYGFILLCPHFTEASFPEEAYQQGSILKKDGSFNDPSAMTYVLIDQVFDFFVSHSRSKAKKYNIYGHSAGSQFVHRYLLFSRKDKVDEAVAANAGWYTFPTDTAAFPYGVAGASVDLKQYYGRKMIILLGEADTLRTPNLRQSPEADAQGRCRLERGKAFYEFCRKDALRRGYDFNWRIDYVPLSGHSDKKMSPGAAKVLYEGK